MRGKICSFPPAAGNDYVWKFQLRFLEMILFTTLFPPPRGIVMVTAETRDVMKIQWLGMAATREQKSHYARETSAKENLNICLHGQKKGGTRDIKIMYELPWNCHRVNNEERIELQLIMITVEKLCTITGTRNIVYFNSFSRCKSSFLNQDISVLHCTIDKSSISNYR